MESTNIISEYNRLCREARAKTPDEVDAFLHEYQTADELPELTWEIMAHLVAQTDNRVRASHSQV